ncbi:MAG: Asp-tRNA(Asn)/Glu-tRNA(Gln) amidotransferase subunit GatB [Planctomycetes bacterium]|nr:Asp-tRNA(Asn)/Glu-tRNA(Gln) amidotransferase subunit GatB [Planctomycetota bacterium]
MSYTLIIGLEVHVQLQTRSKLFCGCANRFNPDQPNTQTCPVCLGLPGSLPVLNREALRLAIKTGMALNCTIARFTKWDRKQYYYPDLPKAYQISQYDLPFSSDGRFEFSVDSETGETCSVGIIRAHLEEDAGKNLHDESGRGGQSRVDLNRCGTPLVEVVSQPDLRSARDARRYLQELKLLLTYLGVSDCNMQEGSLRCDANVNLHVHSEDGHKIATPIVEVKNLNSFRGVEAAIEYESRRQFEQWRETGQSIDDVAKETRGWDAEKGVTFSQRGKEEASDYRYFPDPDLLPVSVSDEWLEQIRGELCEFPADRRARLRAAYELSDYDTAVIIDRGRDFADYFETVAKQCGNGKQAANWITQDVLRELNERNIAIADFPVPAAALSGLIHRVANNEITTKSGREVFAALLDQSAAEASVSFRDRIDRIISERELAIVSDTGALESVIQSVIDNNASIAADVRNGKLAAVGPLIGKVMREVKGADPKTVREMLVKAIQG